MSEDGFRIGKQHAVVCLCLIQAVVKTGGALSCWLPMGCA